MQDDEDERRYEKHHDESVDQADQHKAEHGRYDSGSRRLAKAY